MRAFIRIGLAGAFLISVAAAPPSPRTVRPGELLPPDVQAALALSDTQKKELAALQKEADAGLAKILTRDQHGRLARLTARPRDITYSAAAARLAVEKSLPVLWTGIEGHSDRRTCFTCHNHGVPLLAFSTAKARGFAVSEKRLAEQIEFLDVYLETNRERMEKGRGPGTPVSGEQDTTAYLFLALDAIGRKPDEVTDAVAHYTLSRDSRRDHWATPVRRVPSEASSFTATALAVRGLTAYGPAKRKDEVGKRVEAARGWMLRTAAKDTEDRVFRLIGLKAAGAKDDEVNSARKELSRTQREDGGWGQLDSMESDAYATGSALVALHRAGMSADDPVYRRGLTFLLRTQKEDGSWHVRTRSRPVQRYFETGFPYGKDQWISCAATGWATTALALAFPEKK